MPNIAPLFRVKLMIVHRCHKNIAYLTQSLQPKLAQSKPIHTQILHTHLKNCSNFSFLHSLQAVMIKSNTIQDCYFMNQFISACSSLNQIEYATLAFAQMECPNVFVYNALIRGNVHGGRPIRAMELYLEMLRDEVYPSSYTFSSLIKACGVLFALKLGESLHCQAWKNGFDSHVFILTALVDLYGKLGRISDARKVFDEMPERDPFAWGTMISVLVRAGDMYSARQLFNEMPERNATAWNSMIDGYARLGDVDSATLLFNQMPMKDPISWTTMITFYSQSKRYKEALAIFDQMIKSGTTPDEITLATIISCCAHLGALNLGKGIHFYIFQKGLSFDVYIGSALVDMYAKCGQLDRSLIVFLNLREKNLYCWNSIIEGLGAHGHGKSALVMFHKMLKEDIKPNGVTFISVLSACSQAGLVKEGREIFRSMVIDFQIYPQIEHYGCMVDLLCKGKLLEDALELIRSMKMEPNSVIWGALLSGCKLCKNLEMAEIAVSRLMELEPENCGYYSLLVSMYAEANRWKDVAKIRKNMRELGVEKNCPGSSWIEMENDLHQFIAADKSHPASSELHFLLDDLHGQLKLADHLSEFDEVSNLLEFVRIE